MRICLMVVAVFAFATAAWTEEPARPTAIMVSPITRPRWSAPTTAWIMSNMNFSWSASSPSR